MPDVFKAPQNSPEIEMAYRMLAASRQAVERVLNHYFPPSTPIWLIVAGRYHAAIIECPAENEHLNVYTSTRKRYQVKAHDIRRRYLTEPKPDDESLDVAERTLKQPNGHRPGRPKTTAERSRR